MNEAVIHITGWVATDVTYTPPEQGTARASFRVGSTPRRHDRSRGWVDGPSTFVTVVCWRSLAENVASSVKKGEPVVVTGRLKVDSWERDGRTRVSTEVAAHAVGHDLTLGTSFFRRGSRNRTDTGRPDSPAAGDQPEASDVGAGARGPGAPPTYPTDGGRDPWPADPAAAVGTDGRAA